MGAEELLPAHGGYRNLKSFQVAQLAYDLTVRFCNLYVDPRSWTRDQMTQAARSGVQNIAEGSQASATSTKIEMKLTNVARASLEELRLDYEDYLRQRNLPQWPPEHPALKRFKARRCATMADIRAWMRGERDLARTNTDGHGRAQTPDRDTPSHSSVPVRARPCLSTTADDRFFAVLAANAALSLLNLSCYLLDRQLAAQAAAFTQQGGFTERLHRIRSRARGR